MHPKAYIHFLVHFHGDRDYFECHEILEEYWKKTDPSNKDSIWVGLIQLAVSCYHHRRGNFNGAKKTMGKALGIFLNEKEALTILGLNAETFIQQCHEQLLRMNQEKAYRSFELPIIDPILQDKCKEMTEEMGLNWGHASDLTNKDITHKHILRDRTDVIKERTQALIQKGSNRI